jgi:arginase
VSQVLPTLGKKRNQSIGLVGIPIDYHCSYKRGPALAPPIIRALLKSEAANLSTESGKDIESEVGILDLGDLSLPETESAFGLAESEIEELLQKSLKPLAIGGDHAVTYPILKALRIKYPHLTVVQIDAHSDVHHDFLGDKYSHASVFARIMEEGLCDHLVQIGVRTLDAHQRKQLKHFEIKVIEMKEFRSNAIHKFDGPAYVSFDIDSLDPAFAPGVSHREPGGLSTREAINLLHSLRGEIVGADLVEYNPECDFQNITAAAAAKLIKELADIMMPERIGKQDSPNVPQA